MVTKAQDSRVAEGGCHPTGRLHDKANWKSEEEGGAPKGQAWFERKVAELKAELEKLPADRQEQLKRELEGKGDRKQ